MKNVDDKLGRITLVPGASQRYAGRYVVFEGIRGRKVIAYGKDPEKVVTRARNRGVQDPFVVYVPESNNPEVYAVA